MSGVSDQPCASADSCDWGLGSSPSKLYDFKIHSGYSLGKDEVLDIPDFHDSSVHLSPHKLTQAVCHSFLNSRTALGHFARSSLQPVSACNVQSESTRSTLWPVPPPRWSWSACKRPGVRRRRRKRFYEVRAQLLQLLVISLNWECLGHPLNAPEKARIGSCINKHQSDILERLESKLSHLLCIGSFVPDDLGRANDKFQGIINKLKELLHHDMGLQDLACMFELLHHDMTKNSEGPSGGIAVSDLGGSSADRLKPSRDGHTIDPTGACPSHSSSSLPCAVGAGDNLGSRPVIADRIKWQNPPSFDPVPFLENPLLKAAYIDPETLRKPESSWPSSIPGKVFCSRGELLKLAEKWDSLGACQIFPASSKDWHEAVGLFSVAKDSQFDRMIINPKAINSRMHTISEATKTLAPGSMLGLLHLEPSEVFRICADDLTDFYYTFVVSQKRAFRNCIRMKFDPKELSHLRAFRDEFWDQGPLLIALSTLAMGDSLAVEVAQAAHAEILKQLCGAMIPSEVLRYRFPVPRGDFVELLAIDDHVTLQKLPRQQFNQHPELRDTQVFNASEKAYKHVKLIQQEKKRKRNLLQATVLGCDFDGSVGIASAPRGRLIMLSVLTMRVVQIGFCTPNLLATILGCWIHALLFRRALFSVLDAVFKEGQGIPKHQVFQISRQALNELQILTVLAPMAHSDLRTKYSEYLFTTDASPWGGAVCKARVGKDVSQELWRHSEQKGFYTRLESPVSCILSEKGIEHESNLFGDETSTLDRPSAILHIPKPLSEGLLFDGIELFRGTGNWSEAHVAMGLDVHAGVDTDQRQWRVMDLSDMSVFRELTALALRRVVREWHAGLPCVSFGTLRRPRVRSKSIPFGFDPQDSYTRFHNMLAIRTAMILILAVQGGAYISVEQPGGSCLFHMHLYKVLVQLGCIITHFCFCHFGSAFMKASKWLHNKPWLEPLACRCTCENKGKHFVVQGNFTRDNIQQFDRMCRPSCQDVYGMMPEPGQRVSTFSGAYPVGLVTRMASGSVAAKRGNPGFISDAARRDTCRELDVSMPVFPGSIFQEQPYPPRKWHEDPDWISELCDSLQFRECFRYKFKRSGHINVNESRTFKTWVKSMAKAEPDSRFLGLLDSRVTIGATAKGRSSSFAISRVLQGTLAYVLGANLYPGCLHCGSKDNRADEPSRDKPVRAPVKELPIWFTDMQHGDMRRFDLVVQANSVPKLASRWLRFLLLLGGDIEPHPGPRGVDRKARGPMDLGVGFAAVTSERMRKCYDAFQAWLQKEFPRSCIQVMSAPETAAFALRAYGLHCFESGLPRYLFVYAITAVQDRFPQYRPYMTPAWQIDKKWQLHEPGECRAVLPAPAVRAAVCVAALWHWFQWLGVVLIGFGAMLHPSEMLALTRRDLVLPRDTAFDSQSMFVHVRDPKTARFARRQHGRIDDAKIIAVVDRLFGKLPLSARLFTASMAVFRRQWNAVMTKLHLPCKQVVRGATPAVLRGSGATFLYHSTEDVQWIAWRGRWSKQRTLEFYLQEVSAQLLVHELSAAAREALFLFDKSCWAVLCSALALRCSTGDVE